MSTFSETKKEIKETEKAVKAAVNVPRPLIFGVVCSFE